VFGFFHDCSKPSRRSWRRGRNSSCAAEIISHEAHRVLGGYCRWVRLVIESRDYRDGYISDRTYSCTKKFVSIIYEYMIKTFSVWKVPDEVKLIKGITQKILAIHLASTCLWRICKIPISCWSSILSHWSKFNPIFPISCQRKADELKAMIKEEGICHDWS